MRLRGTGGLAGGWAGLRGPKVSLCKEGAWEGGRQAEQGSFRVWKWGLGTFVTGALGGPRTGHGGLAGCSCPELGVAGKRSDPIHPREMFF